MAREVNGLTTQTTSPSKPAITLSPKKFWMPKGYNFQGREEVGEGEGNRKDRGLMKKIEDQDWEENLFFSSQIKKNKRQGEKWEKKQSKVSFNLRISETREKHFRSDSFSFALFLCLYLLRMYLKIAINKFVWHEFQSHPQWVLFPITFNLCHYILRDKFFSSFPLRRERHSFCFALV